MSTLTRCAEDTIETIYRLTQSGQVPRVSRIANILNVSMPSITIMLRQLKAQGYVIQPRYKSVQLTDAGLAIAEHTLRHHILIARFLKAIGVPEETAQHEACEMEHILSHETLMILDRYVQTHTPFANEDERLIAPKLKPYVNSRKKNAPQDDEIANG